MRGKSVRLVALVAWLDRNAICSSLPTSIVERIAKILHVSSRLRHTPSLGDGQRLDCGSRRSQRSRRRSVNGSICSGSWRSRRSISGSIWCCRCPRGRSRNRGRECNWRGISVRHCGSRRRIEVNRSWWRCADGVRRVVRWCRRCRRHRHCWWRSVLDRRRRRRTWEDRSSSTGFQQAHIVDSDLVRIEETKVALGGRTRFQIFVEESKDESIDGGTGSQGSADIGVDVLDEVAIVSLRISDSPTDFIWVAVRRPTRFRDGDGNVVVPQSLDG